MTGTYRPSKSLPSIPLGAGDAFIGSLAYFLASGHDETEAVARANLYAALSTTAPGTQKSFVTRDRFDAKWVARDPKCQEGIRNTLIDLA